MIRTLRSHDEILASRARLRERGLDFTSPGQLGLWRWLFRLRFWTGMPVPDLTKSWDVASAVEIVENAVPDRSLPVLDMGCYNSEILYVLHALSRRSLAGCDLDPRCCWMPYWHRIRYVWSDLTATSFRDAEFAAITCLSVIEHGVPLERLVSEVRRLLRPGGVFVYTTDYDATGQPHDIDANFRAFGQPWTIFTPEGVSALNNRFLRAGFSLLRPTDVNWSHTERPIAWSGEQYTFILVALKAPEG